MLSSGPLLTGLLLVLPLLWLASGIADYLCHRALHIESTSGVFETCTHACMIALLGSATLIALFLEVNALTLVIIAILVLTHEAVMVVDSSYASLRRPPPWFEQWVHSWQHAIAWLGLAGLSVLYFGSTRDARDWVLQWKAEALPVSYLVTVTGASLALIVLPFAEEFTRCVLAANGRRRGSLARLIPTRPRQR